MYLKTEFIFNPLMIDSSLSSGADNKRSVKYTKLKSNDDDTIQTIHP